MAIDPLSHIGSQQLVDRLNRMKLWCPKGTPDKWYGARARARRAHRTRACVNGRERHAQHVYAESESTLTSEVRLSHDNQQGDG